MKLLPSPTGVTVLSVVIFHSGIKEQRKQQNRTSSVPRRSQGSGQADLFDDFHSSSFAVSPCWYLNHHAGSARVKIYFPECSNEHNVSLNWLTSKTVTTQTLYQTSLRLTHFWTTNHRLDTAGLESVSWFYQTVPQLSCEKKQKLQTSPLNTAAL